MWFVVEVAAERAGVKSGSVNLVGACCESDHSVVEGICACVCVCVQV